MGQFQVPTMGFGKRQEIWRFRKMVGEEDALLFDLVLLKGCSQIINPIPKTIWGEV